jgi:hypothetical protein
MRTVRQRAENLCPHVDFATLDIHAIDEGNTRTPDKRHQPNVMLRHYAGLSEEHGATTSILKQADRPLVYTLRSDVGNHAIGAAPLQGERPNERKNGNMKIQLRGKPPPRRKSPQARMKSLPEDPFIPSYKTLRRPSKTRGTVREMLVGVTFQTTYEFIELLGGQGHGLLTSGDW